VIAAWSAIEPIEGAEIPAQPVVARAAEELAAAAQEIVTTPSSDDRRNADWSSPRAAAFPSHSVVAVPRGDDDGRRHSGGLRAFGGVGVNSPTVAAYAQPLAPVDQTKSEAVDRPQEDGIVDPGPGAIAKRSDQLPVVLALAELAAKCGGRSRLSDDE
jgi:hypothetical protein